MIWNGNYGWLSPAVSLAWQRLEAFQRCRQRNCCRDKNIGGMTMVFIGRNQHSPRWWRGGGFVYLKKKKWNPSSVMIYRQIFVSQLYEFALSLIAGKMIGKIALESVVKKKGKSGWYEKFHSKTVSQFLNKKKTMILNICDSLQRNNYREQILQIEDREDRETNLNSSIRQFHSFNNPFEIYNASSPLARKFHA